MIYNGGCSTVFWQLGAVCYVIIFYRPSIFETCGRFFQFRMTLNKEVKRFVDWKNLLQWGFISLLGHHLLIRTYVLIISFPLLSASFRCFHWHQFRVFESFLIRRRTTNVWYVPVQGKRIIIIFINQSIILLIDHSLWFIKDKKH